jgi:hypothetical protein
LGLGIDETRKTKKEKRKTKNEKRKTKSLACWDGRKGKLKACPMAAVRRKEKAGSQIAGGAEDGAGGQGFAEFNSLGMR